MKLAEKIWNEEFKGVECVYSDDESEIGIENLWELGDIDIGRGLKYR